MIPPDSTLRILLVEGHIATASALAKTLLLHGFAVAPATSARAALEVARQQSFDLLIITISLPQNPGWELLRELRTLQPLLVAIVVTGYAFPQDVQRFIDAGIQMHLTKPVTSQQVLAAMGRLFPDQRLSGPTAPARRRPLRLLYLEDDANDIELLQLRCRQDEPDCELTAATDRSAFIAALQGGRLDGILSDSGVHDLFGADAVKLARTLAPALPYVFLCGVMAPAKRADLLAAKPDGIFSKDRPGDVGLAISLLRKASAGRDASR